MNNIRHRFLGGDDGSYVMHTDSEPAYTKVLPLDIKPKGWLDVIGGKTAVMNQLVKNGNFVDTSGWNNERASLSASDNIVTVSPTISTFAQISIYQPIYPKVGHIYFYCATMTALVPLARIDLSLNADLTYKIVNPVVGTPYAFVAYKAINSVSNQNLLLHGVFNSTEDIVIGKASYTVQNVICIDLTQMFGAGNEPTVDECKQIFTEDYYPYSNGELVSAAVTDVVSEGRNLLNIDDFEAGTTYAFATIDDNNEKVMSMWLTDKDTSVDMTGVYLGFGQKSEPAMTKYVWIIDNGVEKGRSANKALSSDVRCGSVVIYPRTKATIDKVFSRYNVVVVWGETQKPYAPYRAPVTYTVPAAVQALEGYGWSAGDMHNSIEYSNGKWWFYQRVKKVDLSTLTWITGWGGLAKYTDQLTDSAIVGSSVTNPSIVSDTYPAGNAINGDGTINLFRSGTDIIRHRLAVGVPTTPTGFLHYGLETPIVTDITSLMGDFPNSITIEGGGSLTFHNSITPELRLPVPNTERYKVKQAPQTFGAMLNRIAGNGSATTNEPTNERLLNTLTGGNA